ncbi:Cell shape-determining protein MreC [Gammaproteobacteria bacterium]
MVKPLFLQGPSSTVRFLLLWILSVALMITDYRTDSLAGFRAVLLTVVYPVQFLVDLPVAAACWATETLSSRRALLEENASLKVQHVLLKAQLQRFIALETENMRLRALLESSFRIGERVLVAELLAVDLDPFARKIVIDKGSLHGVFPGQPLLDANGVIGQVVHVAPITSTAVLITDPSHALPVQVDRNGLRAIAVGSSVANRLELPYILNTADIREGDILVTSGMGGRFPVGYPAGRILSVERDPSQPFAQVRAEPSADPERSRQVLLLWPKEGNSDSSTIPPPPIAPPPKVTSDTPVAIAPTVLVPVPLTPPTPRPPSTPTLGTRRP